MDINIGKINLLVVCVMVAALAACGGDEPDVYHIDREAVDLGLSVKWASTNVGAATAESMGGLYGWGDSIGTRKPLNAQYPITVSYHIEDGHEVTYVDWNSPYFGGATPLGDISGTEYDCARYLWSSQWRLPTRAEWQELIDRCRWTLITDGTAPVYRVTGPNGNSIVLPLGGMVSTDVSENRGTVGYYWTSTLLPRTSQAQYGFNSNVACAAWSVVIAPQASDAVSLAPMVRSFSLSLRPVTDL